MANIDSSPPYRNTQRKKILSDIFFLKDCPSSIDHFELQEIQDLVNLVYIWVVLELKKNLIQENKSKPS